MRCTYLSVFTVWVSLNAASFVTTSQLSRMPPRRRAHEGTLFSSIRELRDVPREKFLEFVKRLKNQPDLLSGSASRARWDHDWFLRFDTVLTSKTYELTDDRGSFTLESCDPGELQQMVCNEAPKLAELYWQAHQQRPCTRANPWHVIIGYDEFLPGNPTCGQHSKKTMCLYYNFIELGHATLVEGATWLCPLVLPSEVKYDLDGGWSRVLADFLQHFFFGANGFLTSGIPICHGDNMFVLFADLGIIISDGDGLREAFRWRGAASLRPCFRHDNCLRKGCGLAERLPGFFEITHSVATDFHLRSAADLFDSADKVEAAFRRKQAGGISNAYFEKICKAESLNFHAMALPWRMELRNTIDWYGCFTYDWVHTMLQEGPMHVEMFEYVEKCAPHADFSQIKDWLSMSWVFPAMYKSKGHQLWKIFSEWRQNRNKEHDKLHCSSSELLGCYALVRLFLQIKVPDAPERAFAKESFLLCCQIVDIFQAAKKRTMSMAEAADSFHCICSPLC